MILKLVLSASLLTFPLGHVAATPAAGCHELQLSQLKTLNERIGHMIDTISTLLPKSLTKLTSPAPTTAAPSVDYTPSSTGHDTLYYSPPAISNPVPMQHQQVVYVPSYAALPTDIGLPRHSNQISTPRHYVQAETTPQSPFPFSTIPALPPQSPRITCHYEQPPQYVSQMPTHQLTPPTYPPGTYSLIQSPYPTEYAHSYPFGYPSPAPTQPNIPTYAAGVPFVPVPLQIPPGAYMPSYPQISETP